MAVWHEVWIPAAAAGSLYVILLVGMLLMKFRKGRATAEGAKAGDHVSYVPGLFTADTGVSHVVVQPSKQTGVPRPPVPVGFGGAHAAVGGGTKAPCSSFAPIELRWDGLSVSFTNSKGCTTAVLTDQCGEALAGEMLAIMGPSGAGKSTLVDVLSARALHGGTVRGLITANGRSMSSAEFINLRAFVPQEDHFVVSMTALETVQFHAALDLPPDTPREHVSARAHGVLRVMGLSHHSHTLVGGVLPGGVPLRGLSGGQKRRLNIACRIVAAPPVVFLDEPTSGLDSTAALKVMSYMKSYAARQHTIIATLHQPRAAIWALLDKVLFVAFGRLMYLGSPDGVVPWFSDRLGFPYLPAADGLPCDWVMDMVSPDVLAKKWTGEAGGAMYTGSGRLQEWTGEAGGIKYTGSGRLKQWTGEGVGAMYTGSGRLQQGAGEAAGIRYTGSGRLKQWTGEGVGAMYTGSGRLQQGAGEAAGIRYTGSGRLKQWTGEAGGIAYTGSGRISGHGDSAAARSQTSSSLPSGKLSFGAGGAGSGIAAGSWSVGRHTNGVLAAKVRAQLEDASNEFVSEWRASHGGNTYSSSSGSSAQQGGEVLEARASAGVAAAACSSAPHPSGDGCGSEHNGGAAAAAAESAGGDEASGSSSSSSTTTPPGRSTSTPPPPGLASSSVAVVVEVGQPKVDVVVVAPSCPTLPPVNLHKWLHQLRVLLWREGLMITRNPADAAGRMLTCMFTALLVGVVFLALTDNGDAYQARLGCVFVSVLFVVLLPFVNMGLILGDSWLLIRESAENAYSPSACYVARLAINTVLNSCNAIVFASVAYGLVGLRRGAAHVWISNGILTLCHLILCQVMAIGAVWTPTQDMAFMVAVAIVATFILLANFLIRWQEMTWAWVAALRFLSPLYYAFGSLVENEFKDRMLPCPSARSPTASSITTQATTIEWGSSVEGGPGPTSAAPGSFELPCIPSGNLIVSWYTNYSLGTTFAVLVAWWVGLHCITYAGMRWRIWQLRGN